MWNSLRAVSTAALLLLALAGCSGGSPDPGASPDSGVIKIGEYGSLTGSTATFGQSTKNGIDLAVQEINATGGVEGRKLQVIVEDDQGRPEEAAAVVQKLINQDKVVAVLGEVASSRSLAAAPICQQARVPMITPSSTNPAVTLQGSFIFRMCFLDSFQGQVMAQFAREDLGARTAAIVYDVRNDYSVGLRDFFKESFEKLGGRIVEMAAYSEGDKDFKAQLTKIKSSRPDVIVVPGYYTEAGLIAQQARELGIRQPLLGGDGWESPKLLEIGGSALEGAYYTNHYFAGAPKPEVQAFVAKYRERFQAEPDSIAALAYDALRLLAAAMARAPALEGPQIRDAIAATKDFPGVTGTINFDQNRDPIKPAVVLKIEGGKVHFVKELGAAAPASAATS